MILIRQISLSFHSKIVELEEELRVVGNNLKSLEVSEEKVRPFVLQSAGRSKIIENISRIFANFPRNLLLTFYYFVFIKSSPKISSISMTLESNHIGQPTRRRIQEPNQDPHHPPQGGSFHAEFSVA
jgi:hypothetical protein